MITGYFFFVFSRVNLALLIILLSLNFFVESCKFSANNFLFYILIKPRTLIVIQKTKRKYRKSKR